MKGQDIQIAMACMKVTSKTGKKNCVMFNIFELQLNLLNFLTSSSKPFVLVRTAKVS